MDPHSIPFPSCPSLSAFEAYSAHICRDFLRSQTTFPNHDAVFDSAQRNFPLNHLSSSGSWHHLPHRGGLQWHQSPAPHRDVSQGRTVVHQPPSPLLIPIFPQVRQQTGIQAPGLTGREFYEQPMSLHPREPPAVSGASCKATRPESVSWGWGSPPSPGLVAQSTAGD